MNVDEARDLRAKFGIKVLPTVLYFVGGQVRDRIVAGTPSKDAILAKLNLLRNAALVRPKPPVRKVSPDMFGLLPWRFDLSNPLR